MTNFKEIKIERSTVIWRDGIEISAYIAGVNSGMYEFPFVVEVRTWARKWWFKKFFYREIQLNSWEVELLHDELGKVLDHFNKTKKEATE